jgi:16S rRNA (guanine(527)-N(7))-methyltransferase RsmG
VVAQREGFLLAVDAILKAELSRIGLALPKSIQRKLVMYLEELERWNQTVNLTSLKGEDLVRRLIVEPAWIGQELQLSGIVADVGSGNGCPGIALGLTRDLQRVHLIEARTKRAAFLRHIAQRLELEQIVVHRNRVEDIEEKLESVDCITLQAVSPTPHLMKALRRIVRETTRVVWITSGAAAPAKEASRISVPGSNSEVWVFRLDQI